MNLNINKPLCFFDLETTGTNVATDRIVEISIVKLNPDESQETITKRINPQMPIPESRARPAVEPRQIWWGWMARDPVRPILSTKWKISVPINPLMLP